MPAHSGRYLRPGGGERLFGRLLASLVRLGAVRGHFYVLEVRGRKTGRTISLPVDLLAVGGRCYLVCPRGESEWVRNARAAGEVSLVRGRDRRRYVARELPAEQRPPLLKAYCERFAAEVQRFFPLPRGAPEEAFAEIAWNYPVFELEPLDQG